MVQYNEGDIVRTPEGRWLNSNIFRAEGIKYMETGGYCDDPIGSPAYIEYWSEQLRRCKEGYSVGGEKITGNHYSYLNFSEIELVSEEGEKGKGDTTVAEKETKCPDFWDGDYDYYWSVEIARNGITNKNSLITTWDEKKRINAIKDDEEKKKEKIKIVDSLRMRVKPHPDFLDGGHHMIVGKSRRKGYSFKNADICKNIYNTYRKARIVVGAFDKKYLYPDGTAGKVSTYLSFLNKNTAWGKGREYVDKQEHKRASFKEEKNGVTIESGYMSEIIAVTFKDNPSAARGKDTKIVLFEEAGAFPNLKESYNATRPSVEAGIYITGQLFIFGTGGDMEGGTRDFAEMFYAPIQFNLMPFENIWDRDEHGNLNAEGTYCGFFHPVYMNMEGFYDEQGNSYIDGAIKYELGIREKLVAASTSSSVINSRKQEYPMSPSEAFLTVSSNDFPIEELRAQYNKVVREKLHLKLGQPVYLKDIPQKIEENKLIVDENGVVRESYAYQPKVKAIPDLDGLLEPIWDYKPKIKNLNGSVVIYEYPVPNPPRGLYKIGFDPYRQVRGESLAAIYVYKTIRKGDYSRNLIVAQYIGRPYSPNEVNRICVQLCELYNAEVMHENEVTHVKDYFEKKHKLHLLAAQPDGVISNAVKNSVVKRIYGCHMTEKLKDAGEKYIKEWLLEIRDYDETGTALRNIDFIYDPALLEELILFNRKGNFDRCLLRGSKVTTDIGEMNIEDVDLGDRVMTAEGEYRRVTNTFVSQCSGEIYELNIVGQADNLFTTDNHPILIYSRSTQETEYKRADKIEMGDYCLIPKRKQSELGYLGIGEDILYLMGWVLGDGVIDDKSDVLSIRVKLNQDKIADKLAYIINKFVGEDVCEEIKEDNNCIKVKVKSKKLVDFLLEHIQLGENKVILEKLYNTPALIPLVHGLLESNGYYRQAKGFKDGLRCTLEVTSGHRDLLLQVRQILLDNGIWSSVCNVIQGKRDDSIREYMKLAISTNNIDKLLHIYPSMRFNGCNKSNYHNGKYIETDAGFWTPIRVVRTEFSKADVYNIEVEESHTYVAGGIVNHNCMALMQVMFQIAEESEGKEYENEHVESNEEDLLKMMKNQFRNY